MNVPGVGVCFRETTTLSTQSVTVQVPDGEWPFLIRRAAAVAYQSLSEAPTAVSHELCVCVCVWELVYGPQPHIIYNALTVLHNIDQCDIQHSTTKLRLM